MKKMIVIGSFLAVLVLMMLPSISAVEFNAADDANKSKIDMLINKIQNNEKFKDLDINKIQEIIDVWVPGEGLHVIFVLFLIVLYYILVTYSPFS